MGDKACMFLISPRAYVHGGFPAIPVGLGAVNNLTVLYNFHSTLTASSDMILTTRIWDRSDGTVFWLGSFSMGQRS